VCLDVAKMCLDLKVHFVACAVQSQKRFGRETDNNPCVVWQTGFTGTGVTFCHLAIAEPYCPYIYPPVLAVYLKLLLTVPES
jgi:hypothetical protein